MSDRAMRAKMMITSITRASGCEVLKMSAVSSGGFDVNGLSDDNTYAKFSPSGELSLTVANPALLGKFNPGEKYYLDFTRAEN